MLGLLSRTARRPGRKLVLKHRNTALEPLEQRMLLAIDTPIGLLDPAYQDLAELIEQVPANLVLGDVSYTIDDPAADARFDVDTVFDPVDGLRARLRMAENAAPQQGLVQFKLSLHVGATLAASYDLSVLFPNSDMVTAIHEDRAAKAQTILAASDVTPSSVLAQLEADGDFVDLPALGVAGPEAELPVVDPNYPIADQPQGTDPSPSFAPMKVVVEQVDTKLDRIVALAAMDDLSAEERLKIYAGVEKLAEELTSLEGSAAPTKEQIRQLGAAAYLLADQLKSDMASADPVLAAAAKEVFDAAYAKADLYFTGWTGKGINSAPIRQQSEIRNQVEYTVWYESGEAQVSEQLSVDLGRTAMVMIGAANGLHEGWRGLRTASVLEKYSSLLTYVDEASPGSSYSGCGLAWRPATNATASSSST